MESMLNSILQNFQLKIAIGALLFILIPITVRRTLIRHFGREIKLTNILDAMIVNFSQTVYLLAILLLLEGISLLYLSSAQDKCALTEYGIILPIITEGTLCSLLWKILRESKRKGLLSQNKYNQIMKYLYITIGLFSLLIIEGFLATYFAKNF